MFREASSRIWPKDGVFAMRLPDLERTRHPDRGGHRPFNQCVHSGKAQSFEHLPAVLRPRTDMPADKMIGIFEHRFLRPLFDDMAHPPCIFQLSCIGVDPAEHGILALFSGLPSAANILEVAAHDLKDIFHEAMFIRFRIHG